MLFKLFLLSVFLAIPFISFAVDCDQVSPSGYTQDIFKEESFLLCDSDTGNSTCDTCGDGGSANEIKITKTAHKNDFYIATVTGSSCFFNVEILTLYRAVWHSLGTMSCTQSGTDCTAGETSGFSVTGGVGTQVKAIISGKTGTCSDIDIGYTKHYNLR